VGVVGQIREHVLRPAEGRLVQSAGIVIRPEALKSAERAA
jgi:hypothetical protein